MIFSSKLKPISLLVSLVLLCLLTSAQKNVNNRARWFVDSRFGMFIHWGVYSGAEGVWKGEKIRYDNDYAEWIYYRNRIDRNEYVTLLDRFVWEDINPEEWVLLAKAAGMKYVTITAKHHDGFALWDSKVSDYDVTDYTNPKRDIIKELADACKKHGLKLGLYYSHWVDWEHPYGWDHSKEIYKLDAKQYDHYWQEKVMPQMRELLTNYGDIGLIWFDMWIHHSESIVSKKQLLQLKSLIRELQPNCMVNSRLGLSVEEDRDVDFQTLGDNELGKMKKEHPWQTSGTVAHSWGFHALENQWKSTTTLLKALINNVSLNGNFMLNIGPRANGNVPYEIASRLKDMGKWLEVNGEAIYGCGAFDLPKDQHDWGNITAKVMSNGSTKLYLHLFNWPLNKQLHVTGVKEKPGKIYLLADKDEQALDFSCDDVYTHIKLPMKQPDPWVSVIVMEYDKYPEVELGLVSKTTDGGYSLKPDNANDTSGSEKVMKPQRFGSIPVHVQITEISKYSWKIFVEKPTQMFVDVSYNYQGEKSNSSLKITVENQHLTHAVKNTGRYVGEPNSDWHIDCFNSNRLGTIRFDRQGYYLLELEVVPEKGEQIDFQWIWLGEM
ncbi:alpha-L-fucosidase [Puteibacter caeruleilacunae]|nr:alpha-L-fucosidase [Puteibacter caeruleilacunae]